MTKATTKRAAPQFLTMKDSFRLIEWLQRRTFVYGDTIASIAADAADELKNPIINRFHVGDRMRQFEMKIPKAQKVVKENAEDVRIAILAKAVADLYAASGSEVPSGVLEMIRH
jgi:hypothetical protein